jgi:hypothetical protein
MNSRCSQATCRPASATARNLPKKVLAVVGLGFFIVLTGLGCGRKGMPSAPKKEIPAAVTDLSYRLDGSLLTLTWSVPQSRPPDFGSTDPGCPQPRPAVRNARFNFPKWPSCPCRLNAAGNPNRPRCSFPRPLIRAITTFTRSSLPMRKATRAPTPITWTWITDPSSSRPAETNFGINGAAKGDLPGRRLMRV